MPTTPVPALKHIRSDGPYNATSFVEQNKVIVGRSGRLRGYSLISINPGTDIVLGPGAFISTGLALNPSAPTRTAGIIAETTSNITLDASGLPGDDYYISALANSTSEGTTVDFVVSSTPVVLPSQYAPIARYVAGQVILEDAIGNDGVEEQVQIARVDAGAEEFFLTPNVGPVPRTVIISSGNLPDGTLFPADVAFPVGGLTASATNYIFYNTGVGALQFNTSGFPSSNMLPLWEVTLDASSNVTLTVDRRPFIGGGSGGGSADDILTRLRDGLDDSVMQNWRLSNIPADAAPDVDTGTSTGTFLAPSEYQLLNGEILESAFTTSAAEAPTSIEQVTVNVLVDNTLLNPGDLTIEVSRDGGANYETVADNFVNHTFGAVPAGNNLQLRITNASGGTVVVSGFAMYYNNIGGPTGVLGARSGVVLDSSGLNIYNTNPAAYKATSPDFSFAWDSGTGGGTLSWSGGTDLRIEVTDPLLGTVAQTLAVASSPLAPVADGDYVYFDMDRVSVSVTLVSAAGPPLMVKDRFLLGYRTGTDFLLFGNHVLPDVQTYSQATALSYPSRMLPATVWDSLIQIGATGVAPSLANPIATMGDIAALPSSGVKATGSGVAGWSGVSPGITLGVYSIPVGTSVVHIGTALKEGNPTIGDGYSWGILNAANGYYRGWDQSTVRAGSAYSSILIVSGGSSYILIVYTGLGGTLTFTGYSSQYVPAGKGMWAFTAF